MDFLAQSDLSSDSITPEQPFAGSSDIVTKPDTLASGQNLAQYAVVARITASGLLTVWNPAGNNGSQYAVGILCNAINASGGNKACEIYTGGSFNTAALVWPGGTTDAQKASAFDRTNIQVRALG